MLTKMVSLLSRPLAAQGVRLALHLQGLALVWSMCAMPASAQTAPRQETGRPARVIDLLHTSWTAREGAPAGITGIAQTPDGWIWIGSRSGLYKFDGVRFLRAAGAEAPFTSSINTIGVLRDGRLWVGYDYGGVSLLEHGRMRHFAPAGSQLPMTATFDATLDARGRLWLATANGLYYFDHRWHSADAALGFPGGRVHSLLLDSDDVLWARCETGLYALPPSAASFERRMDVNGYGVLAAHPDGSMWTNGPDLHSVRLVSPPRQGAPLTWPDQLTVARFTFSRDGQIWYSTEDGVGRSWQGKTGAEVQETGLDRGLSGNSVYALFEDRERNIWVATESGLDRFRKPRLSGVAVPPHSVGVGRSIAGGPGSSAWVDHFMLAGPEAEPRSYAPAHRKLITVLHRAPDGALWGAGDGELWTLGSTGLRQLPLPAFLPDKANLATLTQDRAGTIWIGAGRHGAYKRNGDAWVTVAGLPNVGSSSPSIMVTDARGRVWIGYNNNHLAIVDGNKVKTYGPAQGLAIGAIAQIIPISDGAWVAGENGIGHFDGTRFIPVLGRGELPFAGITGIVLARDGSLWLNGSAGISSLPRSELQRALAEPGYRVRFTRLDYRDGVRGSASSRIPVPSAAASEDGTLWFSTTGGVYAFKPGALPRNTLVPPVVITGLRSGPDDYAPVDSARLAAGTEMLRIDFTALSYQAPERMEFRYRLDGVDQSWRESTGERSASYTNLGPGRYRFRVTASNNDGVWNPQEASLGFEIAPSPTQTAWFRALCAVALGAALIGLYFWRTRVLARRYHEKMQERLDERERIARALHDTLLQSMQGLILRFQGVAKRLPPGNETRVGMEKVLDQADALIAEGRNEVLNLRAHGERDDDVLRRVADYGMALQETFGPSFTLTTTGSPQPLAAALWPELHTILREALFNAYRHAQASCVEVEIVYGDDALCLFVRDDGRGLPAPVLDAGALAGHWGLTGLRERAQALGGALELSNRKDKGAQVALRIPAKTAYRGTAPSPLR